MEDIAKPCRLSDFNIFYLCFVVSMRKGFFSLVILFCKLVLNLNIRDMLGSILFPDI